METPRDTSTELTHRLASILEDCKGIENAVASYLKTTDERPPISFELLRILSNALAAFELLQPDKSSGEFHGLPREACATSQPPLDIRHNDRPADWNFEPWLSEKLNAMQIAAKQLVEEWLRDVESVKLRADAPMTPKEWVRWGIDMHFNELKSKARVVFEEVCSDRLLIKSQA